MEIGLTLQGYGWSEMRTPPPVAPRAAGARVEFARAALVEWYVNRPSGLEQGFTVAERFDGGDGPLRFEMAVRGPARLARPGSVPLAGSAPSASPFPPVLF